MNNVDALKDNLKTQLDPQQYQIATTRTATGYRRVRGAAGSGKSLALAARAAMLACENKRVLVCTYNITLYNYLRDLVERFIPQEVSQQITLTNFHAWCKGVCESVEHMWAYRQLWRDYSKKDVLDYRMAELVSGLYESPDTLNLPTYHAILLDEGHDCHVDWWKTLRKAIVNGGEALFVCDKTQDIYGTAKAWTDKTMEGLECGFTGRWMELSESYRLPSRMIPVLEDLLKRFPCSGEVNIPPYKVVEQTDMFDKFRWVQVSQGTSVEDTCIEEIERLYSDPDIPTVHFLSGKRIGIPVVRRLKQRGRNVLDTHSENWRESRGKKVNLYPGCAEICATTVHSFKGWETPHLVVHVESIQRNTDRALFYTALSRLNRHPKGSALTVVSSCPELEPFGREHFSDFNPSLLDTFDFNMAVDAVPF